MIQNKRECDGDEGLGRWAKPLRKKDKTFWIPCVLRQGIKRMDKEAGRNKVKTVNREQVMDARRKRKITPVRVRRGTEGEDVGKKKKQEQEMELSRQTERQLQEAKVRVEQRKALGKGENKVNDQDQWIEDEPEW